VPESRKSRILRVWQKKVAGSAKAAKYILWPAYHRPKRFGPEPGAVELAVSSQAGGVAATVMPGILAFCAGCTTISTCWSSDTNACIRRSSEMFWSLYRRI